MTRLVKKAKPCGGCGRLTRIWGGYCRFCIAQMKLW